MEYAGVEDAGVGDRGGKWRSGKCRSDNEWKAVRKEKKSRAYKIPTTRAEQAIVIITAKTQKRP